MLYLKSIRLLTILMSLAMLARASNIVLSVSGCTLGCITSPFAMVTVQQDIDSISVDLSVTLGADANGPYRFHRATDPSHFAMAFDIAGRPDVNINILTPGFSLAGAEPGSYTANPFGTFDYALKCTGCGPGYGGGIGGPLQIVVTPVVGTLTPASFLPSGATHFFTVDIVDFLDNSGNVSDPGGPGVPEPASMLLIGGGLIAFATLARRRPSSSRSRS